MDRDKDIKSLQDLRKRFDFVLTRIRTAHVENAFHAQFINNHNNNNRGKGNPPPKNPPVSPATPATGFQPAGSNPPRQGATGANAPRTGYAHKPPAAGGARINALSSRPTSPPPDNAGSPSHEVCLQPHRNNNTSTPSYALLDSGSSVNTVPSDSYLTNNQFSSGSLAAADGSVIPVIGEGSYSPVKDLTLDSTLHVPSIDKWLLWKSSKKQSKYEN